MTYEKHYFMEHQFMDSQSEMLMDTEEIIVGNIDTGEEYESLRVLEEESWMSRIADIVCIRTKYSMHGTETRELQNDGYTLCDPYYDDDYLYFQKRIAIQY